MTMNDSNESDGSDSEGSRSSGEGSSTSESSQYHRESDAEHDDHSGGYGEVDGGSSSWDSFAEGSTATDIKIAASKGDKGEDSSSSPAINGEDTPINSLKEIVEGESKDDTDDVKIQPQQLKEPPPTAQSASDTPQTSVTEDANSSDSSSSTAMEAPQATEEDVERLKEQLQASLEEENMLISLQMQLTLQLEQLQSAIQSAESEDRIARLAIQQAKIMRLNRTIETGEDCEHEEITINVG